MFLVKREESRNFDVFFGGVLCVFWCLEERKKCVENLGSKQISKKCGLSLVFGVFEAIYSPSTNFETTALRAANLQPPLIGLISTPLKRFGTKKYNRWIKSYGSKKLAVH